MYFHSAEIGQVLRLCFFSDCYDDLGISSFEDCQFSASTAVDANSAPSMAKTGSGGG